MSLTRPTTLRRRGFLALGGATAAGLLLAGCGDDQAPDEEVVGDPTDQPEQERAEVVLDLAEVGGILNYAYVLEQLELAFYERAVEQLAAGDSRVGRVLDDLRAHEQVHVDFYEALLGEAAANTVEADLSGVDFSSTQAILRTASTFENLGVAAYNGAARYFPQDELGLTALEAAGDIVAVEARHAAIVDSLLEAGNDPRFASEAFADAKEPHEVLDEATPFIATDIQIVNVP